jgi:hypothetical protein
MTGRNGKQIARTALDAEHDLFRLKRAGFPSCL